MSSKVECYIIKVIGTTHGEEFKGSSFIVRILTYTTVQSFANWQSQFKLEYKFVCFAK